MKKRKILIVERPWGKFFQFTHNEVSTVKILSVKANKRLSYQSHKNRDEFWRCINNSVKVILNDVESTLNKGDEIFISKNDKHRLIGLDKDAEVLEISFGNFDEEDNTRYEDDFGRKSSEVK